MIAPAFLVALSLVDVLGLPNLDVQITANSDELDPQVSAWCAAVDEARSRSWAAFTQPVEDAWVGENYVLVVRESDATEVSNLPSDFLEKCSE